MDIAQLYCILIIVIGTPLLHSCKSLNDSINLFAQSILQVLIFIELLLQSINMKGIY